MTPERFDHFLAIDWSGAVGERQKGIALAICDRDGGTPRLLRQEQNWSRMAVLEFLQERLPPNTFVGIDLGISLPFADCEAFFPSWRESPKNARALWALIDEICTRDSHLAATSFVDHPELARYFRRHGGREGDLFRIGQESGGRGRFRATERAQETQGCKPYSNFNLVGAAQVGKSSLTGMRMLHRLNGSIPVWPIDPLPKTGSVIVEIYTTIAALAGQRSAGHSKIRDYDDLAAALANIGSLPVSGSGPIDDHSADALITSAWLRAHAQDARLWSPRGLSDKIAQTEGWTFGAF